MADEINFIEWLRDTLGVSDIMYEHYEMIAVLKNKIETNHKELVDELDEYVSECESYFFDRGICPVCGGAIVNERNPYFDTYVPYGLTSVCESEGYDSKCEYCGYRGE